MSDELKAAGLTAYLKVRDVARRLQVSEATAYRLTEPGGPLPALRFGRTVRVHPDDLARFEAASKGGRPAA